MNSSRILFTRPLHISAVVFFLLILAPWTAMADCSEEELTAVFLLKNFYLIPSVPGSPDLQNWAGKDLSRDQVSFWHADTFNSANLDSTTSGNHAWWCGTQFEQCDPDDPAEGYGNNWNQWLDWHGSVPDPNEPVTVTVRARMNLDCEPGYDGITLQYLCQEDECNVWYHDGFAEGLIIEQTFTLQPEDYSDPLDTVHLRWRFRSDGGWSDEDCSFPSAGAAQIDLIEVFFDQGAGPVLIGETETCEPGSELQWSPAIEELQLELLDVAPMGTVTNPTVAEMIEAADAIQPGNYVHQAQAGPFNLLFDSPDDFGGCAIVDGRDGRVIFAGGVAWWGQGTITTPLESSHCWSFPPGEPAADPATVGILPNEYWHDQYPTPYEVTAAAVSYLSDSDVLRSFSECGPYDVVSYIYAPSVSPGVNLSACSLVVIVSGLCGAPWADLVSAAPPVLSEELLIGVNPNPFNPRTTVTFSINSQQVVEISIFDLAGKRIAVLADGLFQTGTHSLEWGGKDSQDNDVASGTYFVQMSTREGVTTEKMMLIR